MPAVARPATPVTPGDTWSAEPRQRLTRLGPSRPCPLEPTTTLAGVRRSVGGYNYPSVPVGYLVSVLVAAAVVALSVMWPRPARGPRLTPLFVLESVANELPFLVVYWLVANTVLAATQGDIGSPVGWATLAIAVCTLLGSAVVIGRAAQAGAALDHALAIGLGDNWRVVAEAPGTRRRSTLQVVGRALIAPVRIPARSVQSERDISYGSAGKANRLDVYRHRSRPLGCPLLIYFHPGGFFMGNKVARHLRCLTGWPVLVGCASAPTTASGRRDLPEQSHRRKTCHRLGACPFR